MSSSAGSTNNNAFEIEDEDEQQVDSEEQQEEKDNEGEIVVDEGQYHPKTLLKELLDQYEDLKKASSQLPPRKASRLTSRAIGNKAKLPQVVRRGKVSKKRDSIRTDAFIAEEEQDDLSLCQEIDRLRNCCTRCDSSTNCIKKAFMVNGKNFDFPGLVSVVRR
eukprot:gene29382-38467_t